MKKENRIFRTALLAVNVAVVLFVAVFIYITTEKIRFDYQARSFLEGVKAIPWNPLMNIWRCVGLRL